MLLDLLEMSDVVFIRNGVEHTSREAAEHLRAKWQAAGDRIRTAEEFIDQLASTSSQTGQPYSVRERDGRVRLAREWLYELLARADSLDEASASPRQTGPPQPTGAPVDLDAASASVVLARIRDSGLKFLRVEDDEIDTYTGHEMAARIQLKFILAGRPETDANTFIDRWCARSSLHGTAYLVRLPDGREVRLADWLREQLHIEPVGAAPQAPP